MNPSRRLARALGRWLQRAGVVATLILVVSPIALGAAFAPAMRELGADVSEHQCKCKMAPGKCGCPECLHLEKERASERSAGSAPSLRGQCDQDGPAFPFAAPHAAVLAAVTATLPAPVGDRLAVIDPTNPPRSCSDEPATPPPRASSI